MRLLVRSVLARKIGLFATTAANGISALSEGTSFVFLGVAVSVVSNAPLPSGGIIEPLTRVLPQDTSGQFLVLLGLAISAQVARSAFGYIGSSWSVRLGTSARVEVQDEITRRLLTSPYSVTQGMRGGDMAEAVLAPTGTMVELIDAVNRSLVFLMMIVVYGAMLLAMAPKLTVLAIAIFAIVVYIQRHLAATVQSASIVAAAQAADATANVLEQTQGLKTIHAFSLQSVLLVKSRSIFDRMRTSNRRLNHRYFGAQAINESAMLIAVGVFLALAYATFQTLEAFALANFVTYVAILNRLSGRCSAVQLSYNDVVRRIGMMARADAFLAATEKRETRFTGTELGPFKASIVFERVSMRYPGREQNALDKVSLTIRRGEAVGLVGESGAGKSTLSDLLLGLYNPTGGEIRIDGVALSTVDLRFWTRQIATVSQDPFLFHGTIADNLRLVRPQATREQCERGLRDAGAWDFVQALPDGENTVIGDRGLKLSGGQRQRIALARALICQPSILLLDEATSALDSETEHTVHQALEALRGNITLIIIAHRLSTVLLCDRIAVLHAGQVVEEGSHATLMAHDGKYAAFWKRQAGHLSVAA